MQITIGFLKSNESIKTYTGKTLLSIARENKIRIMSPCGGNALCGGCKVKVIRGNDILDVSAEEYNKLSDEEINDNYRLACSYIPNNDISVEA